MRSGEISTASEPELLKASMVILGIRVQLQRNKDSNQRHIDNKRNEVETLSEKNEDCH